TIFPAIVLVFLALPSIRLLYLIDESFNPFILITKKDMVYCLTIDKIIFITIVTRLIFTPILFIIYAMTLLNKSQRHWNFILYVWGRKRYTN
ncbi:hypothetical protein HELRODRAFT_92468, partial [Helobdella robusta]|uniref:Cytochrome c oxidase subunit 2 n=1 Tax=Helobdella robusta TaxID=6412 RepID=T1G8G8_HELRO